MGKIKNTDSYFDLELDSIGAWLEHPVPLSSPLFFVLVVFVVLGILAYVALFAAGGYSGLTS